ncbi:hypothetical protein IMG5_201730 [Ichthyophthirius multifiliis]|uniref:Uncharacterized protein n=1 Tax=Ichthyophthirius multifiliis TaxID=5932 RepID=G0R5X1_ICHMU|nr:hypothetical protein IMG5_201730 [Ichthyophthirius multifiliis]EGR27148.1 hypothetical protein IMG5_201730 [Ichthyophthirius multifiliis]|eukprot:XP_004024032.1 hypothetical protein IMG5_201730 [Ichthyophthirius multifiliis]
MNFLRVKKINKHNNMKLIYVYYYQKQENQKILIYKKQSKSNLGEIWSGYLEYLRAEGFCQQLIQQKQQQINKGKGKISENDINWNETDNDLLLKELQNTELHFKAKLNQDKNAINFTFSNGFSNTGCLGLEQITQCKILPIPQFKNRQVLSIACGDHHTIVLVKAFSLQHLYQPNYQQVSPNFDSCCEVFGWGQNTCGQITGDSNYNTYMIFLFLFLYIYFFLRIIDKPLLIAEFSGKQICCVGAYKASSIAVDINGNVYEWGKYKYNQIDNSNIEMTFVLKKNIISVFKGNSFYVAQDNKNQAYLWGNLKNIQVKKDKYDQINIDKIQSISAGSDHIIVSDLEGNVFFFVFGMGDNSKGQLSLSQNVQFSKQFQQLNQLKGYNIQKVQAYQNLSMFISKQGELLYTGEYQSGSKKKNIQNKNKKKQKKLLNLQRKQNSKKKIQKLQIFLMLKILFVQQLKMDKHMYGKLIFQQNLKNIKIQILNHLEELKWDKDFLYLLKVFLMQTFVLSNQKIIQNQKHIPLLIYIFNFVIIMDLGDQNLFIQQDFNQCQQIIIILVNRIKRKLLNNLVNQLNQNIIKIKFIQMKLMEIIFYNFQLNRIKMIYRYMNYKYNVKIQENISFQYFQMKNFYLICLLCQIFQLQLKKKIIKKYKLKMNRRKLMNNQKNKKR